MLPNLAFTGRIYRRIFSFFGPVAQPRYYRGQPAEQIIYNLYMCWFYILKNINTGRYYAGSTNNLERRIKQHKKGYTRTTKVLKTFELVYSEEYDNIYEARKREKQIKSYKSKKYIEWLISQKGP